MEYVFISLLYMLICFAYEMGLSSFILFLVSSVLIVSSYFSIKRKGISSDVAILALMAATIPISFRNIFGGGFGELPLCWFYILGFIYCIVIIVKHLIINRTIKVRYLSIFLFWILLFTIIPFMLSSDKIEAISEYLAYVFFLSCCMVASLSCNEFGDIGYQLIKSFYIFGGIFSSLGIVYQYIAYHFFSKITFNILFFGRSRIYFSFILGDMSSMTVYLATVVLFIFMDSYYKKGQKIIYIFFIVLSMALSSARAGVIALFLTMILYIFLSKKISNYLIILPLAIIMLKISFDIFSSSRELNTKLEYFSNDSRRLEGFIESLTLFKKSFLFGTGFDIANKVETIAHNYIVNLLSETGIVITLLVLIFLFHLFKISLKNSTRELRWVFILSMIGGMVVPGFFNSRFFSIIAVMIILKGYFPIRD